MIEITLDGEKLNLLTGHNLLGELLDEVKEHIADGRIVSKLRVDGEEVLDLKHDRLTAMTLDQVSAISIETSPLREQVLENIEEMLHFVREMRPVLRQASRELRYGSVAGASKKLADCFEGMETLVASIDQMASVIPALGTTLSADEMKFFSKREGQLLGQLVKDFETQEWLALADRLEFQVDPLLGRWNTVLNRVLGTLKGDDESEA